MNKRLPARGRVGVGAGVRLRLGAGRRAVVRGRAHRRARLPSRRTAGAAASAERRDLARPRRPPACALRGRRRGRRPAARAPRAAALGRGGLGGVLLEPARTKVTAGPSHQARAWLGAAHNYCGDAAGARQPVLSAGARHTAAQAGKTCRQGQQRQARKLVDTQPAHTGARGARTSSDVSYAGRRAPPRRPPPPPPRRPSCMRGAGTGDAAARAPRLRAAPPAPPPAPPAGGPASPPALGDGAAARNAPASTLRFSVEFQWFLIALSVRPGRKCAMRAHALPNAPCRSASTRSSSRVHSPRLMLGSRWLCHLRAARRARRLRRR